MALIVHISDLMLDADFFAHAERVRPRRKRDLFEAFGRVIDFCIEADAHLLVVAGNLFAHHSPDNEVLAQVISRLDDLGRRSPRTFVAMAPGACEVFRSQGETRTALGLFRHLSKVSVLDGGEPLKIETETHTLAVAALPPWLPLEPGPVSEAVPQLEADLGILVWPLPIGELTTLFNDPEFDLGALLSRRGVHYLACGGEQIYQSGIHGQLLWAYPGSPEIVSFEEPSINRGFVILNPRDKALHRNDLKFHVLPTRPVKNIDILCSLEDSNIAAGIRRALPDPDPETVVRVSIMGEAAFDAYHKFRRAKLGEKLAGDYFDFIVENDLFIFDDRDEFDFKELLVDKPKVEFKKFMEGKLTELEESRPADVPFYKELLALGLSELDEELREQ